jgi:hypothetical protein
VFPKVIKYKILKYSIIIANAISKPPEDDVGAPKHVGAFEI